MAEVGDERFLVEIIRQPDVEAMARKQGWSGGDDESLREFCEPEDAAAYSEHLTLDAACAAARAHLRSGESFFGCAIIDHQFYERARDDLGRLARGFFWETEASYEVAIDGECIKVAA